jgi:hypothetical protein
MSDSGADVGYKPRVAYWVNRLSFGFTMLILLVILLMFVLGAPQTLTNPAMLTAFALTGAVYGVLAVTYYKSYRCLGKCVEDEDCP